MWQHHKIEKKNKKNGRVMSKVTLSSPCLWASFHPFIPSFSGIHKEKTFLLKSQYEMPKRSM
jgi:hypothetical protein